MTELVYHRRNIVMDCWDRMHPDVVLDFQILAYDNNLKVHRTLNMLTRRTFLKELK